MNTAFRRRTRMLISVLGCGSITLIMTGIILYLNSPLPASAHVGGVIVSTCGRPTVNGQIIYTEWNHAGTLTTPLTPAAPESLTANIYVMNTRDSLYIGVKINDDEFSTNASFLNTGDSIRIDFDNDHSGTLYSIHDEVLHVDAGLPQFGDSYIAVAGTSSTLEDTDDGGTEDGLGAASRFNGLNQFELSHPLCSGDVHDFCLEAGDTVGFKLEYQDAQTNGDYGGSYTYPGIGKFNEADITIAACTLADYTVFLPYIKR